MPDPADIEATRTAYDTVAEDYARLLHNELATKPYDRAVLSLFAELVGAGGVVADVGCGPGRVTVHLADLGLDALGIDLSSGMIAVARRAFPTLRFEVGSMEGLELADSQLDGLVAWYSIIHTPPERLSTVFREFHRVLRGGGVLLLAFQVGDERRHIEQGYGHTVDFDAYRLRPEKITELAATVGFAAEATLVRAPDAAEKTEQAFLILRKAVATDNHRA